MSDPAVEEAAAFAGLIADICRLTTPDSGHRRDLEAEVFRRLGWETTVNKRGAMMRQPGESHWQSMPRILTDFGTAVSYTIGHRYGALDDPLESNWYIREMGEKSEIIDLKGTRIAAWAVSLAKAQKVKAGFENHRQDATAITPAAALVAAWLRTHP